MKKYINVLIIVALFSLSTKAMDTANSAACHEFWVKKIDKTNELLSRNSGNLSKIDGQYEKYANGGKKDNKNERDLDRNKRELEITKIEKKRSDLKSERGRLENLLKLQKSAIELCIKTDVKASFEWYQEKLGLSRDRSAVDYF